MATHEFLTPLAVIDGHAQRMLSMHERLTASELNERVDRIRNAVRRMTQLVDNLIGSAQVFDTRGDLRYRLVEVDLTSVLGEACRLQRELTPDARIREFAATRPLTVRGDAALLYQLFGNILSNAVKYSPRAPLVDVRIVQDEDAIVVVIEDHGIGIPERDLQRVFEHDYRGSNTSGIAGSGIGLYVVKTLVDLHGGSISVDSRQGEGSRFEVRLPGDARP